MEEKKPYGKKSKKFEMPVIGKEELNFSLYQVAPILVTYIVVGMGFGIMAYDAGLTLVWTALSSILIYSGAGQIALVALLKAGTPYLTLILMGFALSGRFIFYGVTLIDRYKKAGIFYPYLIFGLTDEAYSLMVGIDYPDRVNETGVNILVTFFLHSSWIFGSVLGFVFGKSIGFSFNGLDFMLTAYFLTVVISKWKEWIRYPILAGILASLVTIGIFGRDDFIVPALATTSLLILSEKKIKGGRYG